MTPKLRRRRKRLVDDHRPADGIVLRLFSDLQAARRVEGDDPRLAKAQQFERMAWGYLIKYLLTLECDDPAV
jgi:hypothetical protein